ncbi:MAG: hypothetical protein HY906_12255 [Deltaproteobacteria bacterium]|nr:hypothetical protein [Deltaproteobacteria bacterium]
MRRTLPLLLLVVALGCDGSIRRDLIALLESAPAPAAAPCADREARLARLEPVRALVARAYPARTKFDDPLPAALQTQLMETPLTATTVDDWRCLMGDLQGFDPKKEPNYAVGLGTLAALFFDKGTALLAANKPAEGWEHVLQGLRLYARPTAFSYIYFLGAQYFLERTRGLFSRHVTSSAVTKRLDAVRTDATMSQEAFCQGVNEELLAHGVSLYFGHFAAEKPRLAARWGPAAVAHLDAEWGRNNRPGVKAWSAYAEVIRVVRRECAASSLQTAEQRARAAGARLPVRSHAGLLEFTWQRFGHYHELREISGTLEYAIHRWYGPERE